jgi:uncharacterized protein
MNRQEAIAILRQHADTLRSKGVRHAALFGSVARDDNRPDSDVDILVDIDPAAGVTIFDYVALKDYISSLFDGSVDVIDREALKPHLRGPSERDVVYAF